MAARDVFSERKNYMIINANNYSLSPRRFVAGTKGSYGIETMNFNFSEEWNGLNVTVTFFPHDSEPITVVYDHTFFYIPSEVMSVSGLIPYTVVGNRNQKKLVSLTGYIDVLETTQGEGLSPSEPSPSVFSQVLDIMAHTKEIAESVREDADSGVFDGASTVSAEITPTGILVMKQSDGATLIVGNIVDEILASLPYGDGVSF